MTGVYRFERTICIRVQAIEVDSTDGPGDTTLHIEQYAVLGDLVRVDGTPVDRTFIGWWDYEKYGDPYDGSF